MLDPSALCPVVLKSLNEIRQKGAEVTVRCVCCTCTCVEPDGVLGERRPLLTDRESTPGSNPSTHPGVIH